MLESFEEFKNDALLNPFIQRYQNEDSVLAEYASGSIFKDLKGMQEEYKKKKKRSLLTAIRVRAKKEDSFFRKFYKRCNAKSATCGISPKTLKEFYEDIKDVCGARFSCPYFDEIIPTVNDIIRPELQKQGYATDLQEDPRYKDKDYLETGDEFGYRSYHFFVKVPTAVDIYGARQLCLCEVQARSELQHIWADKSRDLLYKREEGWYFSDEHVVKDMKALSHNLRMVDQFLVSIRDRVRKGGSS